MAALGLATPTARAAPWALRGLFAIVLVFALREAQPLLGPVVVAIVLTFVLAPVVRRLRRWGIPEVAGAALVVCALLGSTVPLAASLAEPAAAWWKKAPTTVAQLLARFDRLRAAIPGLAPPLPAAMPAAPTAVVVRNTRAGASGVSAPLPTPAPPADPVKERLASEGVVLTGALLRQVVAFGFSGAATVILLYFLLASEHWMLSRCVEALPRRRTRALLLGGVRSAQREIGRYLFALGCINAAAGAVTGLALWALGLPNPTLWGVIVAVLCFVPYLGPIVIMALLLLAGMSTFDELPAMLAPAAAFMAIHAVESNAVSPWIVGRRLSLSPISVFLSVMFWGWLWGIAGALIAVPLLIAVRSVCVRTRGLKLLCRFLEGDRRTPPTLRALLKRPRDGFGPGGRLGARARPAVAASEAVHVAHAGDVHVFTAVPARHEELVAVPLQHHP
jgi:predicted PurR-regulated permease PerM